MELKVFLVMIVLLFKTINCPMGLGMLKKKKTGNVIRTGNYETEHLKKYGFGKNKASDWLLGKTINEDKYNSEFSLNDYVDQDYNNVEDEDTDSGPSSPKYYTGEASYVPKESDEEKTVYEYSTYVSKYNNNEFEGPPEMKGVKDWTRMQNYKIPGMDEREYDYQIKMQEKKDIKNKWDGKETMFQKIKNKLK